MTSPGSNARWSPRLFTGRAIRSSRGATLILESALLERRTKNRGRFTDISDACAPLIHTGKLIGPFPSEIKENRIKPKVGETDTIPGLAIQGAACSCRQGIKARAETLVWPFTESPGPIFGTIEQAPQVPIEHLAFLQGEELAFVFGVGTKLVIFGLPLHFTGKQLEFVAEGSPQRRFQHLFSLRSILHYSLILVEKKEKMV